MVLVAWILRKAERRDTIAEITRADWTTRLDFRKKEKKATKNKARIAAWRGLPGSNKETICKSKVGVIGDLRAGAEPKKRLQPRNASWKEYERSQSRGKPNERWKCLILAMWFWTVPYDRPEAARKAIYRKIVCTWTGNGRKQRLWQNSVKTRRCDCILLCVEVACANLINLEAKPSKNWRPCGLPKEKKERKYRYKQKPI